MTPPVNLRPYQREQIAGAMRGWDLGHRAGLVEAATGTGKTTTVAEIVRLIIALQNKRGLVMAHRRELLDQLSSRLEDFGVRVSRDLADLGRPGVTVVASVTTVRLRLGELPVDCLDLVVIDEAHHACAPGYREVLAGFPSARVLGVTATPDRADRQPLGSVFDFVAHRYGIADAIRDGYLSPVRGIVVEVPGLDLSRVRQRRQKKTNEAREGETIDLLAAGLRLDDIGAARGGQARVAAGGERYSVDLHPGDLGRAVIAPEAVEGVVGPLMDLAGDRRTVVFAADRRHARALTECINVRRRGAARWVDGSMKARERAETLEAHKSGCFQFLVNVMLLTEGYDDPQVSCVAMVRPTMSRVIYAQACGRGLRLARGKVDCLVLDFTSASSKFDLVGPDDVLGAAMSEPARRYGGKKLPKTIDLLREDLPSSSSRHAASARTAAPTTTIMLVQREPEARTFTFRTRAVSLVRGAGRAVGSAGKAVTKEVSQLARWFIR